MMESEKALEDYLFSLATEKKINPLNGYKIKWVKRQVRLASWGIVDLMMEGEDGFLYIIELKNTRFRTKYLFQGMKYLACLNVGFDDCDHHSVSILCMGGEPSESSYTRTNQDEVDKYQTLIQSQESHKVGGFLGFGGT